MLRPALIGAALAGLMLAAPAPATAAPGGLLVSFDDLQARLPKPGLRLLDVRPRADYDKGHVPGAIWVDGKAAQALAAKPGGLADRDAWAAWTAPLAISPDDEVLVLDGARQLDAARVWWLLSYLGVAKVGLVDGNMAAWDRERRPMTVEVPKVDPRPFPVTFQADRIADQAATRAAIEGRTATVIDARSHAEYVGGQKMSRRAGHIPDACRVEWSDLVTADGRFVDEATVRSRISGLKLPTSGPVITHCQGGGRASVDAFVFERLGFPVRNYYLGWSDWGNTDATPVDVGDGREARP